MTFKFILTVWCMWCLVGGAQASFAQSIPTKDERTVTFRAVAWNRDLLSLSYLEKGKPLPLRLPRRRISQPQTYTGGSTLLFYDTVEVEGKRERVPLTQAHLGPDQEKVLIVVWQGRDQRYVATVLSDDSDTLKGGQVRFVNLAGKKLAISSNRQTKICVPGEQYVADALAGGMGIKVAVEEESSGGWKLALMNGFEVQANERVTVFITNPRHLAPDPEEMGQETNLPPLELFVLRDRIKTLPRQ